MKFFKANIVKKIWKEMKNKIIIKKKLKIPILISNIPQNNIKKTIHKINKIFPEIIISKDLWFSKGIFLNIMIHKNLRCEFHFSDLRDQDVMFFKTKGHEYTIVEFTNFINDKYE